MDGKLWKIRMSDKSSEVEDVLWNIIPVVAGDIALRIFTPSERLEINFMVATETKSKIKNFPNPPFFTF